MKILILGSGGRECAFAWKLSQSSKCSQLFIAPGNAGTAKYGTNVPILATDFSAVKDLVIKESIGLVLVGPEDPLVKGVVDFFASEEPLKNIPIVGPSKLGATLEGSKDFSKNFMHRHGIPTASSKTFTVENIEEGITYLKSHTLPIVLKADGLAAGKGVLICPTHEEAVEEFRLMLVDKKFGEASAKVVVEQCLKGIELSVFVLTDGISYKILPEAKDYKRIGEGDTGLNTGGMGSISPVHFADAAFMKKVEEKVIIPTVEGIRKENIPYKGFIFIGLMNDDGEPQVIEYNVRMGDPETESVIPRIESDLVDLLLATYYQNLSEVELKISPKTAATVMLVSGGYPQDFQKNKVITGLENLKDSFAFHAGTSLSDGQVLTNGGRVLALTCLSDDLFEALQKAITDAGRVHFDNKYFRRDIGFDLLPHAK